MSLRKLSSVGLALFMALAGLLCVNPSVVFADAPLHSCVWTGAFILNANFSTAANWSDCGGAAPGAGDALYFGEVDPNGQYEPHNDLASGTAFYSITVQQNGGAFIIGGNSMVITHNILNLHGSTITAPVTVNDGALVAGDEGMLGISNLTISANSTVTFQDVSLVSLSGGTNSTALIGPNVAITATDGNTVMNITSGGALNISSYNVVNGMTFTNDGVVSNSGQVIINSGAILKGNGLFSGTVVVNQGGTLAPGHSPGCLTVATVSISGTYQEQIGGATTACTDYDQLVATDTVNILNGTLDTQLINGFTPVIGQTFKIIDNQGFIPVLGTFNGLPEGAKFSTGGQDFRISYIGGTGNDVTLTALGVTPPTAAGSTKAPGSPNTGLVALKTHPIATMVVTTLAALMILIINRRLQPIERR